VINFRYHLVSIVAVLFALAIGIVVGSGFLAGPLRRQIREELSQLRARNNELQGNVDRLQAFAEAAEDRLIATTLTGEEVVVFTEEGTDGGMLDALEGAVEEAGGTVALTVSARPELRLEDQGDRRELARILGTKQSSSEELRADAGNMLGAMASEAAATSLGPRLGGEDPDLRFESTVTELAAANFVAHSPLEEGGAVPTGAVFLIAAGGADDPPFAQEGFVTGLALGLSEREGSVLAAEPAESAWGVVPLLRDDSRTVDLVSTVSEADTLPGRIAVVLALDDTAPGRVGHYGTGAGTTVLPDPIPG
jgi:hypothetical protein